MSDETKHTPGPWTVDETYRWLVMGPDRAAVGRSQSSPISGRAEANARLIAAAPELAEALETIERSGAPGGTIVAKRPDDHACGWCRGMLTPCPSALASAALEKAGLR